MNLLDEKLAGRLQQSGVTVTTPDGNTVRMQGVPLDPHLFSKDRTKLLLRRLPEGSVVLAVDQDLDYIGPDPVLSRAFASGKRRNNWRVMVLPKRLAENGDCVASAALSMMGLLAAESEPPARDDGLIARFGKEPGSAPGAATLGRCEEIARLVGAARAWQPRLALAAGPSGAGKTNLVEAAARALRASRGLRVVSIDLGVLMAGAVLEASREELVARLLDEAAKPGLILALENIERAVVRVPNGHALLAAALDRGARLFGTALPENLPALLVPPLTRRIEIVELPELSPAASLDVLRALAPAIAQCHGLSVHAKALDAALARSHVLAGALPARALTLLDAAAGRAAAVGAAEVEELHVYLAASDWTQPSARIEIREASA